MSDDELNASFSEDLAELKAKISRWACYLLQLLPGAPDSP